MSEQDQGFALPPASFEFLVASLSMQAQAHLGLIHFGPEEERPEPNLPLARHAIDLLAVLTEKTRGNLSLDEQRTLENSLTELRFRFVQVSDDLRAKKTKAGPEEAPRPEQAGAAAEGQQS
jgi:non-ribosomal peptide synthetase component F